MAVVANALNLKRLRTEQTAWSLLRAANAPVIIAVLDSHFGPQQQRIPVPDFVQMVEADLEDLRYRTDFDLPSSAQSYCENWRNEGYLVRRPMVQTRQETYELSQGAAVAIAFAKQFSAPRRTATQSRLTTIIAQIDALVFDTSANVDQRRSALQAERERIDAQLALLDTGRIEPIGEDQALERIRDIIDLAQGIPTDFLRVRDDFEHINQSLHESIIESDDNSADILRDIFDGVDTIGQSPSGQSFKGFYQLLRDAESTEALRDHIDAILASRYARLLDTEERKFLRSLIEAMLEGSQEVNLVMTSFARGLRRFVQNQSYQNDRALKREIDQALGKTRRAMQLYPGSLAKLPDCSVELTRTTINPITRLSLKNPAEAVVAPLEVADAADAPVMTLEELRETARQTDIDFHELATAINDLLALRARAGDGAGDGEPASDGADGDDLDDGFDNDDGALAPPACTVADVLAYHPATQGIASVVGLVVLAQEHGQELEGTELVTWHDAHDRERAAFVPRLCFTKEVES